MISVLLQGGLGNQLFQISALVNLAVENNESFAIDLEWWPPRGAASFSTETFQAKSPMSYKDNIYRNLPLGENFVNRRWASAYHEEQCEYKKIPFTKGMACRGYFSSEKYFIGIEKIIKTLFRPPNEYIKKFNEKYRSTDDKEIIAIHVRRGEYLKDVEHHPPCKKDYFEDAI